MNTEITNVEEVKTKKEREKRISDRNYFVMNQENEVIVHSFQSEDDCKQWIMDNGDIDVPYKIGYSVVYLQPLTKKAKITLQ
jgi:hypothetical protein